MSNMLHPPALASRLQLNPRSLEAFDGPYDLWEEAAKEALELVLDAANQPMILLDRFARDFETFCCVRVRACVFLCVSYFSFCFWNSVSAAVSAVLLEVDTCYLPCRDSSLIFGGSFSLDCGIGDVYPTHGLGKQAILL